MPDTQAINDLNRLVGGIAEAVEQIKLRAAEDRQTNDSRHRENQSDARELRAIVEPLSRTVAAMSPMFERFKVSRGRVAVWASIGLALLAVFGWVLEALIKFAVTWLMARFH